MYRYLCNITNIKAQCDTPLIGGGLKDDESYDTAKKVAIEAAESDVDNRCGDTVLISPGMYCNCMGVVMVVWILYRGDGGLRILSLGRLCVLICFCRSRTSHPSSSSLSCISHLVSSTLERSPFDNPPILPS